jgi:hypothetical protein
MPEPGEPIFDRPKRRRSKTKEIKIDKLPLNDMQRQLFNHLSAWAGPDVTVIHPQEGMNGEVQPIAIGFCGTEQNIIRLDHVPPVNGVPFRVALRAAFEQFPFALYLRARSWAIQPPRRVTAAS